MQNGVVVEAPVVLNDVSRFFENVGGMKEIQKQCKESGKLKYNLRPNDPNSIALIGKSKKVCRVVVKIVYEKDKIVRIEKIAMISYSVQFKAMADVQYVARPMYMRNRLENVLRMEKLVNDMEQLELVPGAFMKTGYPQPYDFKKMVIYQQEYVPWSRNRTMKYAVLDQEEVPKEINIEVSKEQERDGVVLESLRAKFRLHPVWMRRKLMEGHTLAKHQKWIEHWISQMAYTYNGGPWRQLCIRNEYDPRYASDGALYQVIEVKFWQSMKQSKRTRYQLSMAANGDAIDSVELFGNTVMRASPRLVVLVLDLMNDSELHEILIPHVGKNPPGRQTTLTGWFPENVLLLVQAILKLRIEILFSAPQSDIDSREGKIKDLRKNLQGHKPNTDRYVDNTVYDDTNTIVV